MTIRHEMHCVNCGESKDNTGRARLTSEEEEEVLIDCKKCGSLTTIVISYDENANQTTIEIENLKPEEYVARWKNVTKDWDPILICPFCGSLPLTLKEVITKDAVEKFFDCDRCKRVFEVERA